MNLLKKAQVYRQETGMTGGVVIFHRGKVQGWCDRLRDPGHWKPGCVAVDVDGRQWKAAGGDGRNGAKLWVSVQSGKHLD